MPPSGKPRPFSITDLVGDKYGYMHVSGCVMSEETFVLMCSRIAGEGSIGSAVTWPVDTALPANCNIAFNATGGRLQVKVNGTRYPIDRISDLTGRDRVLRPCDNEILDRDQRRLYKKFTEFILPKDVRFEMGFECVNKLLSYTRNAYKIEADRPVPLHLSKLSDSDLELSCDEVFEWGLSRSKGKHLLHITSHGDKKISDYNEEEVVYVGATLGDSMEEIEDQEKRLRLQYIEAVRRCEIEADELTGGKGRRSVLPSIRSYPDMQDDGLFDEWNQFLELFREIAASWSLPACGERRGPEPGTCAEEHIPGQCLDVKFVIMNDRDRTMNLEVESYRDSGEYAFTNWRRNHQAWRDAVSFSVCVDICPNMKIRRMLRRAQDRSVDINGISQLIAASRVFTIAAVCGNRRWMKDYSYFCFLGKGERSRPIVKELAVTVRDIQPYAFITKLIDPNISTGDMRYCSGAEKRDGIWHCTENETVAMPMELEDKIAGTVK